MIGYWFYKYEIEDKDVGVVDYAQLSDEVDVDFPAISLCLEDPFNWTLLDKKLKELSLNMSVELYWQYLAGELYNDAFEQIDYDNVTIDLRQYFRAAVITWRNGSYGTLGKFKTLPPYLTAAFNLTGSVHHHKVFSGFQSLSFLKCFMIMYAGEDQRQIKDLRMLYDLRKLEEDWQGHHFSGARSVDIYAHYPGQFFLKMNLLLCGCIKISMLSFVSMSMKFSSEEIPDKENA